MRPRPILPFLDYQRIYKTIAGLCVAAGADIAKSCVLFSITGAYLLNRHYGIDATPVAGGAFYRVGEFDQGLAFAEDEGDGAYSSSQDGFHCWIEARGWIIDFTAPFFPEMLAAAGGSSIQDRLMFQRPHVEMSVDPFSLAKRGDFYLKANLPLTQHLIQKALAKAGHRDLIEIACSWYKALPKKMLPSLTISNDLGEITELKHFGPDLTGSWVSR